MLAKNSEVGARERWDLKITESEYGQKGCGCEGKGHSRLDTALKRTFKRNMVTEKLQLVAFGIAGSPVRWSWRQRVEDQWGGGPGTAKDVSAQSVPSLRDLLLGFLSV